MARLKSSLSPQQRPLVAVMRRSNHGCIANLAVRNNDPRPKLSRPDTKCRIAEALQMPAYELFDA